MLEYDLSRFRYEDITSADITRATFELSVANDYRIEVASNLQTDGERFNPKSFFYRCGARNVQDNNNTGFIRVDYGLPTANELLGTNWEVNGWHGLSIRGEAVLNRRFFSYPNSVEKTHRAFIWTARHPTCRPIGTLIHGRCFRGI